MKNKQSIPLTHLNVFRSHQACAYLGIGESTFFRYIQKGLIEKGIKYSARCTVWKKETLDEFLDKMEQLTTNVGEIYE